MTTDAQGSRFTLDEDKAREWIGRAIAQSERIDAGDGTPMTSITDDLDAIASLDRDIDRLADRLRALRLARANADRRIAEAVGALVRRCEEDPAAGAGEMRAAMAGREREAGQALGRHSSR